MGKGEGGSSIEVSGKTISNEGQGELARRKSAW